MTLDRKNTRQYIFKVPKVESLLTMEKKLTSLSRSQFEYKYGSILNLLHVKVDPVALTTLAQFYDDPLRCFTFQDFQLLPTLEEFEMILGRNIEGQVCYTRETPTLENVAKALYLRAEDIPSLQEFRNADGFSKKALEAKAYEVLSDGNKEAYNALLALLIYGLVLFPSLDNFIDLPAVAVFLTGNPIPALLADFIYSLHYRYNAKRAGKVDCCTPLIMRWLMLHKPKKETWMEDKETKWKDKLSSLTANDVYWYSRELDSSKVFLRCGEFPNIPLIGTRGCINYNPVLALRQLGHAMEGVPPKESLTEFVLKEEKDNPELWGKIKRAWRQASKTKMKKTNCLAQEAYTRWVEERVKEIKLPFIKNTTDEPQGSEPIIMVPMEEVEALKKQIVVLQKKDQDWQFKDLQSQGALTRLKRERDETEKEIQSNKEKMIKIKEKKRQAREGCRSANANLDAKNEKIQHLEYSYAQVKKTRDSAMEAQGKWQKKSREQESKLQELKLKYQELIQKEALKEQKWENTLRKVNHEHKGHIENYEKSLAQLTISHEEQMNLMNERIRGLEEKLRQCQEEIEAQKRQALQEIRRMEDDLKQHKLCIEMAQQSTTVWKNAFVKLVTISNAAIDQLPRNLKMAEIDLPLYNVPEGIKGFLGYCRGLLQDYKKAIWETRRYH